MDEVGDHPYQLGKMTTSVLTPIRRVPEGLEFANTANTPGSRTSKKMYWQCDVGLQRGVVLRQTKLSFTRTTSAVYRRVVTQGGSKVTLIFHRLQWGTQILALYKLWNEMNRRMKIVQRKAFWNT